MTNPTLGLNLGRWAEVYCTTPPEQREQAVLELLRELEQGEQKHPELVAASHVESPVAPETRATNEHIAALEEVVRQFEQPGSLAAIDHLESQMCPVCQHANRPDQLYCGMCGYRLNTASANQTVGEQSSPSEVREQGIAKDTETVLPLFGSHLPYTQEPETVRIMYGTTPWPLQAEDEGRSWGSTSKVIAVVAVLAAAALVFLYQRRAVSPSAPTAVSSQPSAGPSPSSTEPVTSSQEPALARDSAETAAAPVSSLGESQKSEDAPTKSPAPATPSPNVPETPAHSADAAQSAAAAREQSASLKTGVPAVGGNEEFERARELLAGRTSPPDAGQASVWLWKAVAKHNVLAVLLLADLYARGDGVPRSCDQARILLTAASKRGSVEANQKLQELRNSGCSER